MMKRSIIGVLAFASIGFSSVYAQFIGATHSIGVEHGVYQVGPNQANPVYNPNGFLLSPGAGYPLVVNPTIVSSSFVNATTGSPGFAFLNWVTGPVGQFGGARTRMFSEVAPFRGRIWWTDYFVRDVPSNDGVGTYNASGGNVLFQNGNLQWATRAGIFFPFNGFAIGPNAYVAGAMKFRFTIFNALNAVVDQFILGVHFGFDGPGGRPNGVFVYGDTPAFWGWRFNDLGNAFSGYGLAWRNVVIPAGGKATLEGRLTMLADPDSGFDITNEFDSEPEVLTNLPDLGYTPVPEPASMTALGIGLLSLLARRRRRA